MGGVSYKTESSPITPVKQSLVFLYGMFKPCANFVGITVISAPVSSKKSISFYFSYSQPQQSVFFPGLVVLLEEPELAVLQFQWSLAELLQGCRQAEKEQNYA